MAPKYDPSKILTDVVEKLSLASSLPMITQVVAEAARKLSGAAGATFVLREDEKCYYVDEDSISPLWKGKKFPIDSCISGWSMKNKKVVIIPDVYQDERIPISAYQPTFVKSLCMVPIRAENPLGAIGNYWADGYVPKEDEIKLLQVLANSAAIALENLQLKQNILNARPGLEAMEDRQRQFEAAIHTLAHDLRNPLSTMMLFTDMIKTKLKDQLDPRLEGYFNSILKTGRHANEQISKMLELYTVSSRNIKIEEVNLSAVVSEISAELQAQSPTRLFDIDIEPDQTVFADPHLIRLAMENLMTNAFKYTSKKEVAQIEFKHAEATNSFLKGFSIRDNGDGFEESQAKNLFRPLVRLHDDSEFQGTGLGLASVARILELHGGDIRAEGKKSHGAVFYFNLPIKKEHVGIFS